MQKIKDISWLLRPATCASHDVFLFNAPSPRLLLGKWRGATARSGLGRPSGLPLFSSPLSLLASLLSLILLTACSDDVRVRGYDYDKREKAKVMLPKGSSMDLDTETFVIRKKYDFPYWSK